MEYKSLAPLEEAGGEVAHVLGGVEDVLVEAILRVLARQALVGAHHLLDKVAQVAVESKV